MGLLDAAGILFPGALYLFAIVPALVLAYLARERPRQVIVSSVLAFRALHVMRGERFGGRPRFNWTFFLELLVLCLAVLAATAPYLVRRGNPIAVVLDNSAAMGTRVATGQTRFELARDRLKDVLRNTSGAASVTVYATAPGPHALGGAFSRVDQAIAAIDRAKLVDAPDNPAALTTLLTQLNSKSNARIIVAGYRPIASPVPARVTPVVVGEPTANYAIGSFALSRETLATSELHARVTVANFSPAAKTLKIIISGDGKNVGQAATHVEPGESAAVEFRGLPAAAAYRAQLEPSDALNLDNVAYATASSVKQVSLLFISPVPADGAGLKSIPGVGVTTVSPNAYSPDDSANADVAIFEYSVPKALPTVSSLLVIPPPGDPLFNFAVEPASRLMLTSWPTTDPLTEGVNFRLLDLHSGEYFGQHAWMRAVVSGASGGLLMAGQREGHRFLATGFNPFPYLGKQNLPMSVLTLNMLSYLADLGAQTSGFRTGEPWIVPAGVREIIPPSGRKEQVVPGTPFNETNTQGLYTLVTTSGTKSRRAVNLNDLTTSDLEDVTPLRLDVGSTGPKAQEGVAVRTPLAPYVLLAIITLIAIEAMLVYRRRRSPVELRT